VDWLFTNLFPSLWVLTQGSFSLALGLFAVWKLMVLMLTRFGAHSESGRLGLWATVYTFGVAPPLWLNSSARGGDLNNLLSQLSMTWLCSYAYFLNSTCERYPVALLLAAVLLIAI
jgi:hypothetical protein